MPADKLDCTKEEFFLLLRKWKDPTRRVVLTLTAGQMPLSGAIMARISGFILNVDEAREHFTVATIADPERFGDEDFATIGVHDCIFRWGDEETISTDVGIVSLSHPLEEVITLHTPSGVGVGIFALKETP
jgi:hypothetical protein